MRLLLRTLAVLHRYLGIALGLLVVLWFGTGIVMVFANDMPRVTDGARLAGLAPIDFASVHITPAEALTRAGLPSFPARMTLTTVLDRPVYRLGERTIYADTGEQLGEIGPQTATAIAARFAGVSATRAQASSTLTAPDQWTLTQRRSLPLHRIVVDDDRKTVVYVAAQTGEVAMATTARSRLLAMTGAIPHWLYLAPVRARNTLWRQVVLWTSGLTCLLAVSGLLLGVVRTGRAILQRHAISPYAGWLKWHHVTGLLFGAAALTWAFSGFLSMEPWGWASDDGDAESRITAALAGGPPDLTRFPPFDAPALSPWGTGATRPKEIELTWIQDAPYYIAHAAAGRGQVVDATTRAPRRTSFPLESFLLRVAQAAPEIPITDTRLLDHYDSYYYSQATPPSSGARPLPVVRMTLADGSWLYIDPATSRLAARVTKRDRLERWLYRGLHRLDFPFWYSRTHVWRAGVIALLSGGLVLGLIGVVMGTRRVRTGRGRS